MPIVHVKDPRKPPKLYQFIFPLRTSVDAQCSDRWEWPELKAERSGIQGFGLFTRSSADFDWSKPLARPVIMPYLGKETEVESAVQARVLRSVLCGCFDVVQRSQLQTPAGHQWVQDGLYVTLVAKKDVARMGCEVTPINDPDERLLQVSVEPEMSSRAVSYVEEGDEQVCYLVYEETRRLLHLPPHVFELLCAHAQDEHADRNMATHLVQFSRAQEAGAGPPLHLLVSAHPLFRNSAFMMGNVNEPPRGPPSLELHELKLVVAADDDPLMTRAGITQDPATVAQFRIFAHEHPEVLGRSSCPNPQP